MNTYQSTTASGKKAPAQLPGVGRLSMAALDILLLPPRKPLSFVARNKVPSSAPLLCLYTPRYSTTAANQTPYLKPDLNKTVLTLIIVCRSLPRRIDRPIPFYKYVGTFSYISRPSRGVLLFKSEPVGKTQLNMYHLIVHLIT